MTGLTKDGQAVASSNYNLYGARKTSTDTTGNSFAYNGEARDNTGLDYLRARYYDSQGGTFLTEDSYPGEATDPLSQNGYSYVQNNPVNYIDPSGHRMVWMGGEGEPSRPRSINTRLQRFYQRSIVEEDSLGRAVSLHEYTDHRIQTDRNFRAPVSYYQAFGPNVATYQGGSYGGQSSYAYAQQQAARARAQAEQRRRQQIRYEYGLATGIKSSPTIREGLNLLRNWNTALQNTLKHVCNPKTTKGQDDASKKKLTASELRQLVKKANSGDMSAVAALSRSYDGKSGIGTDTRTKEEISAGNRLVWKNAEDGLKKIPYIIGEFFSVNDTYRLTTGKDPETGENASRIEAAGWLLADIVTLKTSKVAKGAKAASKGLQALDAINDASKVAKAADKAKDVSKATISKTPEITINFTRNSKHRAEEFSRQLTKQQNGMNRLTVADYINNRGSYLANGRSSAGNAAQKAAREKALADKYRKLRQSGLGRSEAKSEADRWIKTQAALHDPDQIAGGFPKNVTGVGDFGINSSIGVQWKDKIATVDNVVDEIVRTTPYEDLNKIYLNVKLQY